MSAVNVLAVFDRTIDAAIERLNPSQVEESCSAFAAVEDLIAAAEEVRDVAWGPGETDQPHIIRLNAALAACKGGGK